MVIKLHHALFGFVLFTLTTSLIRNSSALSRNMPFLKQLESALAKEKDLNNSLKLQKAYSQDPYRLDKILRDKLGLVKKNEEIIIIPTKIPSPTISPTPEDAP